MREEVVTPVGLGNQIDRQHKRLRKVNTRLMCAVADLTLDNQILKEAAPGNY